MTALCALAAVVLGLLLRSIFIQRQADQIGKEIEDLEKKGPPK